MAINVKEYAGQLAKEAGLPEDQAKVFLDVLGNEKVSKAFEERMLAKDDYSRNMDAISSERKKLNEWYGEQVKTAAKNQETVNSATAQVKQYVETYGELPNGVPVPGGNRAIDAAVANYISKDDHEKAINNLSQQFVGVLKSGLKASSDYQYRFGKPLDVDALEKFAVEHKLPLDMAYEKFISPEVQAKETANVEERVKAAREEGLREGRSLANVPIDAKPKEPHVFFDRKPADQAPQTDRQIRDNFAAAWVGATK